RAAWPRIPRSEHGCPGGVDDGGPARALDPLCRLRAPRRADRRGGGRGRRPAPRRRHGRARLDLRRWRGGDRSRWAVDVLEGTLDELVPRLASGDVVVDGGNSFYQDDIERAKRLAAPGLHYVDCGTSGGVWGLERGYCLMIGGESEIVRRLDPLFATLAPGAGSLARTPGREKRAGTAEQGYLHCGPNGAGHFVKMVHNGIEYGLMAAYAEGLNVLRHANVGKRARAADAETTPLRNPEYYQYDLDLADIAEVWRRGS